MKTMITSPLILMCYNYFKMSLNNFAWIK